MRKTNNELLKERIEQNRADFRAETLLMDEGEIYDMAARIAAVEDTYYQMTEHEYLDEDEAGYLLKFHDPLEMIADCLGEWRDDEILEMDDLLSELLWNDDNEERYVTAELAGELKQKHGAGTSIRLALLTEAIEAGSRFARLWKLIDDDDGEGVDFCSDEE